MSRVRVAGESPFWPVGQAVKTPPFHGGIPGSIPGRVTTYGRLAQLGERLPYKQDVGSSILSSSTTCGNSSAVEHRLAKAGVASSNLVSRSIHSSIAQLVEQSAVNRSVVGSSPTRGANFIWPVGQAVKTPPFHGGIPGSIPGRVTTYGRLAQLGERLPYKQDVGSSILSSSTNVSGYLRMTAFCYS